MKFSKYIVISALLNQASSYTDDKAAFDKYDFIKMIGGFLNGYGATNISESLVNMDKNTGKICGHKEIDAVEKSFLEIYDADQNTPCYQSPYASFNRVGAFNSMGECETENKPGVCEQCKSVFSFYPKCDYIQWLYYCPWNAMCYTCQPLCPSAAHPRGTWDYFQQTGTLKALGENSIHFITYFKDCLMPELTKDKKDPDNKISPIAAKIMKVATRIIENSLGIGQLKVTGKVVEIMYHVYHLVEYLDKEKTDFYNASWEVGAIVKDLESIIDQLTNGGTLLSIEELEIQLDAIEEKMDKLPKFDKQTPLNQNHRRLEGTDINVKHHDLKNVFNENSFEIFAHAYYSQMKPQGGGQDIDFSKCVQHKDQTKELYEILGQVYKAIEEDSLKSFSMIFQHYMIEINKLILDVQANGCQIEQEVIDNIQHVNALLKDSTITHQKEKSKVDDFEKILITPTIVHVNGVDLSAAARIMKTQFLKIQDAKEAGQFSTTNTWYNVGRTAGVNVPLIQKKVPESQTNTGLIYGSVAGLALITVLTSAYIIRKKQIRAQAFKDMQDANEKMIMPISDQAIYKSVQVSLKK